MYLTHHFHSQETLHRARHWFSLLGYEPDRVEARPGGTPRLTLHVDLAQAAGAQLVLHAVESTDPKGWPGLWDTTWRTALADGDGTPDDDGSRRSASAIHWTPPDRAERTDPELIRLCERLGH